MALLSATNLTPGNFFTINYAQGLSGIGPNGECLLICNALASSFAVSSGQLDGYVWSPTVEGRQVSTEADVIAAFGSGSEAHMGYRQFVQANGSSNPLAFIIATESVGAAATMAVTFTGTASANGTVRCYVGDATVNVPVSTAQTPTALATAVAAAINGVSALNCTAGASGAIVTITAKQKGPRGNLIRAAVKLLTSCGVTSSAQNFAMLAGGTTEDSHTAAIATANSHNFDVIVSAGEDPGGSANLGQLIAQVVANNQAVPGYRQRVMTAQTGSLASALTFQAAINCPQVGIVLEESSNRTPFELACYAAGTVMALEGDLPSGDASALNFDGLGSRPANAASWQGNAPFDGSSISASDIQLALLNGLSPVKKIPGGKTCLVSLLTSYATNPATSQSDQRVHDWCDVSIMNEAAVEVGAELDNFQGLMIGNDPVKGGRQPAANVATPSIVRAHVNKAFQRMSDNGLLLNIDITIASTTVTRVGGRYNISAQLYPAIPAHQFVTVMSQLGA